MVGVADAVWAFYHWQSGIESTLGSISIGAAEWFTLSVVGVIVALWASFHGMKKLFVGAIQLTAWYQFGEIEPIIAEHRRYTENFRNIDISRTDLMESRQSLILYLQSLQIRHPELKDSDDIWVSFLTQLRPLAIHRRVKEARQLFDSINLS